MKVLTGVGKPYGARDPRACDNTKAPASGAIPADLAKQYFICQAEGLSGRDLYLVDNVNVEIGGGRPYSPNADLGVPDIDPKVPIYPIRGSYTQYQCGKEYRESPGIFNVGKNCQSYVWRAAKGECYKTTFGDWHCSMSTGFPASDDIHSQVAPPK